MDFDYRSLEVWHLGLPDDLLIDSTVSFTKHTENYLLILIPVLCFLTPF